MKAQRKEYLGDAVYVAAFHEYGGVGFVLTTSDGISDTNSIVLEPRVYEAFIAFAESSKKGAQPAPPPAPETPCLACDGKREVYGESCITCGGKGYETTQEGT